jgi:hypothetical protein
MSKLFAAAQRGRLAAEAGRRRKNLLVMVEAETEFSPHLRLY